MAGLRYNPVFGDLSGRLAGAAPDRVLVIGDDIPESIAQAGEARWVSRPPVDLPRGLFEFDTDDGAWLLAVALGDSSGTPAEADWDAPDDDPLISAYSWMAALWETATAVPKPAFSVGDAVLTVPGGQEGVIRGRDFEAGSWSYRVRVEMRTLDLHERSLAAPHLDDDPFDWISTPPADVRRFAATLTRAKLREELTDTVFSFRATKTLFRPYQFRPVMRFLETQRLRLLIADEVGLGKTIEAGLLWTELDARRQADRVLVVCPSMLVPKWRAEMLERFDYDLDELDRTALDEMLDRIEADRLPGRFRGICSLERLRMWDGLERMAELSPRFDLVIVDEAHALRNMGTRSHAMGSNLSDWADALVFLSATPLNLGNDDLYNLLELLAPGEFDDRLVLEQRLEPNAMLNRINASLLDPEVGRDDRLRWLESIRDMTFGAALIGRPEFRELEALLVADDLTPRRVVQIRRLVAQLNALSAVVTRTRKVETQEDKAVREAHAINVDWSETERTFYDAFEGWQIDRARRKGLPVGFVTQMPLRLASSCLPAARDRVLSWESFAQRFDEFEELEGLDDDLNDMTDLLEDVPPSAVIDAAKALGERDSKFDAFASALAPIVAEGRRVLVFTFSRAAVSYLYGRLRGRFRVAVMHGGVGRDERHQILKEFREHEHDVLLATRVASEGLDLEFCSAVVNWDLPWNPMEVEQRIGRVDRFGQTEDKVLVLNFHTPGTIETDIIERVHQRIGVFQDSIGELEPILRSRMADLRKAMFDFSLSDEQRALRIEQTLAAIEEQRRTREDLDEARAYLTSMDRADIDGFEQDLVGSGRYVGQQELVLLIEDWIGDSSEARLKRSQDGSILTVVGSERMEEHLRAVQAAGERSSLEIDRLARKMRDGSPVYLSLDSDVARTTGQDLLNANHAFVRAALRVPGYEQARFSHLRFSSSAGVDGRYLVLLAIARWVGLHPSTEFWTAAVDLATNEPAPSEVGDSLLAGLAEARLEPPEGAKSDADLEGALRVATRSLRSRQRDEEERRSAANDALIATRGISLRETHARKVQQIHRRIATLRREGKTSVLHLQEAQLRNQDRLLRDAESDLESRRACSMTVEYVAVAGVEVTSGES